MHPLFLLSCFSICGEIRTRKQSDSITDMAVNANTVHTAKEIHNRQQIQHIPYPQHPAPLQGLTDQGKHRFIFSFYWRV